MAGPAFDSSGRGRHALLALAGLLAVRAAVAAVAADEWPPAPPLPPVTAAQDLAPLPPSIAAERLREDLWRCTFRFRPAGAAERVALVGSFNGWDREATPMRGPDASGEWRATLELPTGLHEYKFLVNGEAWLEDPAHQDRIPDGYGRHNSFVRLGRLATLERSVAAAGDGQIDTVGLAHRPPLPLYIQPLGPAEVAVRYRTLAHDVQRVWLAVRDGPLLAMPVVNEGPLFAYREARLAVPARDNPRTPTARTLEYTFVLDDGAGRVGDPHTYHYSFTTATLFEAPEWARHAVWYEIVLDRFRNGDPANDPERVRPWTGAWFEPSPWEGADGGDFYSYAFDRTYGGDLAGLAQKLPYLKELGVTALCLTPIFKAPSYHKYDVQDFRHVDDAFGTRGDYAAVAAREDLLDPGTWQWTETDRRFLALLAEAHALGLRVVLDGVFHHVGAQHPAFLDVQARGPDSPYADWFDIRSWTPLTYRGWAGFVHMPAFRKSADGLASPGVKAHLFHITRRWMDPDGDGDPRDGIDGWRLDVPQEMPLPFWAEWRRLVKQINPDALITGEAWQRADPWLDGRHFDAVVNYEFARTAVAWIFDRQQKITASAAASRLEELRLAYPAAATHVLQNLVGSRDTDRMVSMAHNPDRVYDRQNRVQDNNPDYDNSRPGPEAYARARLAALLQMTYIGTPLIYYGDEAGMWGADDPSNRKPMLWEDLEPYAQSQENHVLDEHLAFYRRAIALRHAHAALRTGTLATLVADDAADVWAFVRSAGKEHALVVLNASAAPRTLSVPLPEDLPRAWTAVFGAEGEIAAADGRLTVPVPAIGGVVLRAGP